MKTCKCCFSRSFLIAGILLIGFIKLFSQSHSPALQLDTFINNKLQSLHIPGLSLAVVEEGKIIYTKGYGLANLENQTPARPETNFLIASVTKSFTATAIMMLWEEGKFSLEDSIGQYLEDLPAHWNPLTIRQLLNHTSGVPYNIEPKPPCQFEFDCNHYTLKNYLQEVACLPLNFPPGTEWRYSGTAGYTLLGMLIEKLSGKTYWEFLDVRIFSPLGMNETGPIDYTKLITNRASGYNFENGEFLNSEQLDPVGEFASGGLMSTVLDLAKWDAALYTEKLLKRSTLELMWDECPPQRLQPSFPPMVLAFGLTPYLDQRRVGHTVAHRVSPVPSPVSH
ncbi:MAG: serine hydrolase domain-containing protein [Saprospiraceae bacterium]